MTLKINPVTDKLDLVVDKNLSGTAQGQMSFWDATLSKWVQTETSELFWDDVNKRLGIGTALPGASLNITNGEIWCFNSGNNPRILIGDSGTSGQYGYLGWNSANDYYVIETDGTNGLKIKGNNVAIGNIFPGAPLIVGIGATEHFRVHTDGKVGIGTTTPDTKLQIVGNFKSGEDTTNYLSLASDGEIGLHGTARVTRHLRVGAGLWCAGASAPTQGCDGVFVYLEFDHTTDDTVYYITGMPARWDSSTDVEFAIDWYYTGAQDNGTVCWKLEYKGIKDGEAVTGAGTTITETTAGNHTTGQMVRTTFTTKLLAANFEEYDTIGLKLSRDVSEDTLATGARGINAHFHLTMNKLGKAT